MIQFLRNSMVFREKYRSVDLGTKRIQGLLIFILFCTMMLLKLNPVLVEMYRLSRFIGINPGTKLELLVVMILYAILIYIIDRFFVLLLALLGFEK